MNHSFLFARISQILFFLTLAFAPIQSEASPQHGEIWEEPLTGMEFVWVPTGCFQMGCGPWADSCADDAKPVHEVCLGGFWMGKHEVTQTQWEKVMGANPSHFKGPDNPVEQVSWNDAQKFIKKLNNSGSSSGFRLPREAEWEYACRGGGRQEKYCGGDNLDSVAWYSDNSEFRAHPVGRKAPNALGLYDMSGNVREWVLDWYGADYYAQSPRNDPEGPPTGSARMFRGGSWYHQAQHCSASRRFHYTSRSRSHFMGLRLVLSPGQQ